MTVTVGVGTTLAMMTDVLVLVKVFQISVDICKGKNRGFSLRVHDLKTPVLGFLPLCKIQTQTYMIEVHI